MVLEKIKSLFRKEGKKEVEVDIVGTCFVCNQPIYKNDEYKKIEFQGNVYFVHKKCFRKAKRMAKKIISKGVDPRSIIKRFS